MIESQQEATFRYFNDSAGAWRQRADGLSPARVNVIKQRNDFVLSVARGLSSLTDALDVGCGTGELVCDLARSGVHAVGVDFAGEMIKLAREKAAAEDLGAAAFVEASIFDYHPAAEFDLLSANGFIEYISGAQLLEFIAHAKTLLRPGGSLVLGSRNRLFNVFSLNEYTAIELKAGSVEKLIKEAMLFAKSETLTEAIEQLLKLEDPLPSIDSHPRTGVEVSTRHQYTPGELARLLADADFGVKEISFIHFHAAGPRFAQVQRDHHVELANFVQSFARDAFYLLPFASSFMLHAQLT